MKNLFSINHSKEIKERRITFGSNGIKLRGRVMLPSFATAGSPVPGVVLCHGFGSGQNAVKRSAKMLARQGIASTIFDFRGHCTSGGSVDGKMADDVFDAWNVLKDMPEVDQDRMGLGGHSLGAMSAILAAGRVRDPKVLFALSCPPHMTGENFPELTREFGRWGSRHNHIIEYPREGAFPWLKGIEAIGARVWMYLFGYTVRVEVRSFFENSFATRMDDVLCKLTNCNKLFVFCEGDTVTPYNKSILVYEGACEPKIRIVSKGGIHTTPIMRGNLRSQWINWVATELKK
jgi:pimeloyl-ACP methyl ester carboxylesterase